MKFSLNKPRKMLSASRGKPNLKEILQLRAYIVVIILLMMSIFVRAQAVGGNMDGFNTFPVSEDKEPLETIWVVATAYSSDVGQTDSTPCIPADGYDLCKHYEKYGDGNTVAANFLPLGSQVKFPEMYGDKVFVVHDRMNSRYGYGRIDIWMPTYEEARDFGVRRIKMERYAGDNWKVAVR